MRSNVGVLLLVPGLSWAGEPPKAPFQPYAYAQNAASLGHGHVALQLGGGYNGVQATGGGLAPEDGRAGLLSFGASVGVVGGLQVDASLQFGDLQTEAFGLAQSRVEARVQLVGLRPSLPFQLALGAGYQSDARFDSALTGLVAMSGQAGPVDLTANLRLAHYFHEGRDPVDIMLVAGALARPTDWLGLGAEYVGEELEEAGDGDEDVSVASANVDGGGRHLVGPTVAFSLAKHHVRINLSGGAVISSARVGPQIRGSIAYQF